MSSFKNVLEQIRSAFEQSGAQQDLWYLVAAVALSTLNHPEDIAQLYSMVTASIDASITDPEERERAKINATKRLREALLKGFVATGFPKAINSLDHLNRAIPEQIKSKLPKKPIRSEDTWEEVVQHRERGRALFAKIYDRHTDRVLTNMHSFYPDLCQTALYQIYGPVFSDTTVLGAKESSMVLVTGLKATDVASQLKGHAYGALHNGATKPELRCINVAVDILCQHYKLPIPKAKL